MKVKETSEWYEIDKRDFSQDSNTIVRIWTRKRTEEAQKKKRKERLVSLKSNSKLEVTVQHQ